jgi:hypothetical protein
MRELTIEELEIVARLTTDLTRLRQNECKSLCIENFAPEVFEKLVGVLIGRKPEST